MLERKILRVAGTGLLAAAVFAGCGGSSSYTPIPKISVTSPNGGETWYFGGPDRDITWTSVSTSGQVDIHYTTDSTAVPVVWIPVATGVADSGSHSWTIPDADSPNCRVRVQEAGGGGLSDESDADFTISPPRINVTSPSAGVTWYYEGTDQQITWTSGAVSSFVDIHYATDSGAPVWVEIALSADNDGSFPWPIPDVNSTSCVVRVQEAGGGVTGLSPDFAISPAAITVDAPNGAETWVLASMRDISWTGGGFADVKIELSRDGNWTNGDGSDVETIVASTAVTAGSYTWQVSGPESDQCLVRVSDAADGSPADESDAAFSVLPTFNDISATLQGVTNCALAWGDYDNDGDLDLALAGRWHDGTDWVYDSKVYRNDGGAGFTDIGAPLTGVGLEGSSLAWGDYDNDGDLDLALAGSWDDGTEHYVASIYRNDSEITPDTFVDIGAPLTGVDECSLAWGDYDNDGDLDLALAGKYIEGGAFIYRISKVYRNDGGTFVDIGAPLVAIADGALAWGDYDNDGDLDLALAGKRGIVSPPATELTTVYRNEDGAFVDIGIRLMPLLHCALAWGDYDNDGDLDLAVAGRDRDPCILIYRNSGGVFTDIGAGLSGGGFFNRGSLSWGDYDNDGDLDLALAGGASKVYRNDNGMFTDIAAGLTGVSSCSLAWGDYDNDGDLDLALAGLGGGYAAKVYRNNGGVFNTAPAAPGGLGTSYVAAGPDYDVTFTWAAPAVADETPGAGLSYNLRVGTTMGGNEVFSGMAQADGWRKLPARGAAQPGLSVTEWTLTLPADTYYWSVQTIDTAFAGSAWPAEETTTVP